MQIIDFNVYSDDCLNVFFILLSICLIVEYGNVEIIE